MTVRIPTIAVLLGLSILGGCLGPDDAVAVLVEASPAAGLEPAWAAARKHDSAVVLLSLQAFERPVSAPVGEDGEPWGFYEPVFGRGDSRPGDGAAPAWLWTFGALEGPGLQVVTSGSMVVATQPTPDFWVAEDNAGLQVLPDGLFLDTESLARAMDQAGPGWSKGSFAHDAIQWTLQARGLDPLWIIEGALTPGGTSTTFAFDALTGQPPVVPPPPAPWPRFTLSDCTNFGAVFPVPLDSARAVLPDGFEAVASPNDPAGGATLYVLYLDCAGSTVYEEDTGAVQVAYAELAVEPPAEFVLPGITDYTVPLAFGATNAKLGALLADLGLGVAGAGTSVATTTPAASRYEFTVGAVKLELTGQAAPFGAESLGGGAFALVAVQNRTVRGVLEATAYGGQAVDAAVVLQSEGVPLLEEARPATRGFSASGFSLAFQLMA